MVRHPPLPVLLIGLLCVVSWALDDDEDNGKTLMYKVNQLLYDGWKFKAKACTHNRVYPPLHHPSPPSLCRSEAYPRFRSTKTRTGLLHRAALHVT